MNRGYYGGFVREPDAATLLGCSTQRFHRMALCEGLRWFQITKKTRLYAFADVIAFAARVRIESRRFFKKKPSIRLEFVKTDRLGNAKRAIVKSWKAQQRPERQLVKELKAIG